MIYVTAAKAETLDYHVRAVLPGLFRKSDPSAKCGCCLKLAVKNISKHELAFTATIGCT
jgi:hypothetical protein